MSICCYYGRKNWLGPFLCILIFKVILTWAQNKDLCDAAYQRDPDPFNFGPGINDMDEGGVGSSSPDDDNAENEDRRYRRDILRRKGPNKKKNPHLSPSTILSRIPLYGNCIDFTNVAPTIFKRESEYCHQICGGASEGCRFFKDKKVDDHLVTWNKFESEKNDTIFTYCFCDENPTREFAVKLRESCFVLPWDFITGKPEQRDKRLPPYPTREEQEDCDSLCSDGPSTCLEGGPKFNGYLCPYPYPYSRGSSSSKEYRYVCTCHNFLGGCLRRDSIRERPLFKACREVCGGDIDNAGLLQCRATIRDRKRTPYCACENEPPSSSDPDDNFACSRERIRSDRTRKNCKKFCRKIPAAEGGPYYSWLKCVDKRDPKYYLCACYNKPRKGSVLEKTDMFYNWPPEIEDKPRPTKFITWSQDNKWKTWAYSPKTANEVVIIANWAMANDWKLRPSGKMHSWSPLTLPIANLGKSSPWYDGRSTRYLLLKTNRLNRMGILSRVPGQFSFWTQPGVLLEKLLAKLQKAGMGFLSHPAAGGITMGGIVAVGGHGTGVKAENEKLSKGHTYGSLSNLIMSLTAVVYNQSSEQFELKTFKRTDEDISAFLVCLGRTFITNMTLRAGPLQYIRSVSYFSIPSKELFASPQSVDRYHRNHPDGRPLRTVSHFLNTSGRFETILFPSNSKPWLKVYSVVNPNNPKIKKCTLTNPLIGTTCTRKATRPYPYKLADHSSDIPLLEGFVRKWQTSNTTWKPKSVSRFLSGMSRFSTIGKMDLWGPSKNVLLYVKPNAIKFHMNGYVILTTRNMVQEAVYRAYSIYKYMIDKYQACGANPVNGPFEMRVTGVDNPSDVGIPGAMTPDISATRPIPAGTRVYGDNKNSHSHAPFDTAIWVDTVVYTDDDRGTMHYLSEVESHLENIFNCSWAEFRIEWSKGFAYEACENFAYIWTNTTVIKNSIFEGFLGHGMTDGWAHFKKITAYYDPARVFSNEWLEQELQLQSPDNGKHKIVFV